MQIVILRSKATKNLLLQPVDSEERQILRFAQDDKKRLTNGEFQQTVNEVFNPLTLTLSRRERELLKAPFGDDARP